MISTICKNITGAVSAIILSANTLFCVIVLVVPVTILKLTIRFKPATVFFDKLLNGISLFWTRGNNTALMLTRKIVWTVQGTETLEKKKWYLVISNHQSWTDIVVLQKILYGKVPFIKFFLKKELIWVPVLGMAWWALDFPFMKRYSKEFLEKNPHLKGKDIEITKKACAKFSHIPVSIMNFVEGTRFTAEKHDRQNSPFRNLLKPKSGGIGFVFSTMGQQLSSILDITIVYPGGPYSFWDFLCGQVTDIRVDVQEIPVTEKIRGDYVNDAAYRNRFQHWLNDLWEEKDLKIDLMLDRTNPPANIPEQRQRETGKTEITEYN